VEVSLGGEAVEEEAGWGDEDGGPEDAETHFGFADAAVLASEVGGEAVGCECEGKGEEESDCVADGDEA
tara:strand:+ start:1339 stop:1545 length:207 start_codon:yes stop_codon:yes gene_type:complete